MIPFCLCMTFICGAVFGFIVGQLVEHPADREAMRKEILEEEFPKAIEVKPEEIA